MQKGETKSFNAKMVPEHPVTFSFNVDAPAILEAYVKPDETTGNVRISRLIDPKGESDGPFGGELQRELTESGMYQLVINENMMAGDRWTGTFTVTLTLR